MDERGYAYLIGWSTDFSRPGQASTDCSVVHTTGYSSHPATRQRCHPTPLSLSLSLSLPHRRRRCPLASSPLPLLLYHRTRIHSCVCDAHERTSSRGILAKNCKSFVHDSSARARFYLPSRNVDGDIFRFRLILIEDASPWDECHPRRMIEGFSIMQQILPPLDRLEPLLGATQSPRSAWALASWSFRKVALCRLHCISWNRYNSSRHRENWFGEDIYTHSESQLNLSRTTFLSILHNFGANIFQLYTLHLEFCSGKWMNSSWVLLNQNKTIKKLIFIQLPGASRFYLIQSGLFDRSDRERLRILKRRVVIIIAYLRIISEEPGEPYIQTT